MSYSKYSFCFDNGNRQESRDVTNRHHKIIIVILTTESYNYQSEMTRGGGGGDYQWCKTIQQKIRLYLKVLAVLTSVSCLRNEGIFFIIWAKLLTVIWGKCIKNYTALNVGKKKKKSKSLRGKKVHVRCTFPSGCFLLAAISLTILGICLFEEEFEVHLWVWDMGKGHCSVVFGYLLWHFSNVLVPQLDPQHVFFI